MTITSAGTAHMHRAHGVPRFPAADQVRIRTRNGNLVGSGILRYHHHGGHD